MKRGTREIYIIKQKKEQEEKKVDRGLIMFGILFAAVFIWTFVDLLKMFWPK